MKKMYAVNYDGYGGLDALRLCDVPMPEIAADEVLIRVHAASLNPFDWKLRSGMLRSFFDLEFPITPGRDGCGEIVSLGKTVEMDSSCALHPGQRVSFVSSRLQYGALAEYCAVKAADFVVPVSQHLTSQQCRASARWAGRLECSC